MSKLELADIADVIRQHVTDEPVVRAILADLVASEKQAATEDKGEKTPRAKSKLVVLVRGDSALKAATAGGAWVLKVEEANDTTTLLDRIYRAAKEHNDSLKGNRRASRLVRTFARAIEWLRPKVIERVQGAFKVVTKQPVEVIVVEKEGI